MSAIADFVLIPISAVSDLRAAAALKNAGRFGKPVDAFAEFMQKYGSEAATYHWSGWVMSTLLTYLSEKHAIDLIASAYDELSEYLSKVRGSTYFVLTNEHRHAYADKLGSGAFNESELRDYYNEFNDATEQDIGRPMLDGIKTLHDALARLDDSSIVIFSIG